MKTVVICGSRNPEGQTATANKALIKGLQNAGAEVEQFFLPKMNVHHCQQCEDSGWGLCRKEGRCTVQDDFQLVIEKIREADNVVFSTPVYYADLSESLKAFSDRLRRVCTQDKGKAGIAGKPMMGICVAGGRGGGSYNCATLLEKVMTTCGFDVVDMIPVRRQNLQAKLLRLEMAGQWFATSPRSN